MNNKNFETISELKEYINDFMKLPSEKIFKIYLFPRTKVNSFFAKGFNK